MDTHDLRREYRYQKLSKRELSSDPCLQFERWYHEAVKAEISEPNAFALATAYGKPSCRMVLMKQFDHQGLVFYTNYQSRKAKEIERNPWISALFFWKELERQACLEGPVKLVSKSQSEQYFSQRPRGSQLGAWASSQDLPLRDRHAMEEEFQKYEELYRGKEIPMPPWWGGFRLEPASYEFWQGRRDRMHDRFKYVKVEGIWTLERLSP